MTRVYTAPKCPLYNLSERIMLAFGMICSGFWGFVLTDSALEQAGILPNLVIKPEAYGFMQTQSMLPMLGMGIICLAILGCLLYLVRLPD